MRFLIYLIVASVMAGCTSGLSRHDLASLIAKAEAGDAAEMFMLGTRYDRGVGVPRNTEEAAKWYLKSAEAGFAEAQNSIGSMYQAGEGVSKDFAKARMWYAKAAGQEHLEGTHNLAFLYDEGLGVTQDNEKAIELYTKAAERGFAKSMLNLGIMHRQGDGVPMSLVEAHKWLDLARFHTQTSKDMQLKWHIRGQLDALEQQMSHPSEEFLETPDEARKDVPKLNIVWNCGECIQNEKVIPLLEQAYKDKALTRGQNVSKADVAEVQIVEFDQRNPGLRAAFGALAGKDRLGLKITYKGKEYVVRNYSANGGRGMNFLCEFIGKETYWKLAYAE